VMKGDEMSRNDGSIPSRLPFLLSITKKDLTIEEEERVVWW